MRKSFIYALAAAAALTLIGVIGLAIKGSRTNDTFRIVGSVTSACQGPFADDTAVAAGATVHVLAGASRDKDVEVSSATLLGLNNSPDSVVCKFVFIADKVPAGENEYVVMIGGYRFIPKTETEARAGLSLSVADLPTWSAGN